MVISLTGNAPAARPTQEMFKSAADDHTQMPYILTYDLRSYNILKDNV